MFDINSKIVPLNMPFTFEIKKSINVVLFLLKSLGGKAEIFYLFNILYIAEVKHLMQYGILITGDDYIAMKNGIVPFNIYSIYRQIKGDSYLRNFANNFKEYLAVDQDDHIVAITDYNQDYISSSEAACLFDSIRENKNELPEVLRSRVLNYAWDKADLINNISLANMAISAGANEDMVAYIQASQLTERILLNEKNAPGS